MNPRANAAIEVAERHVMALQRFVKRNVEKEVRSFLEAQNFDFNFVKSKTYCAKFFTRLSNHDKKRLVEYLTDFGRQPFIKAKKVTPDLLTKIFSSEAIYLYWINSSSYSQNPL